MIDIKKPFIYLREFHHWFYKNGWHKKKLFVDPLKIMAFEKRELMSCKLFEDQITRKKTKDADYKVMDLLTFLSKSNLTRYKEIKFDNYYWDFNFIRLGLKIIKNAEICVPTKESFPLIIRNNSYNFYIAPKIIEEV